MTPLEKLTTILARTPGIPDSTPLTMGGEVELEVTMGDLRWLVERLSAYEAPGGWRGLATLDATRAFGDPLIMVGGRLNPETGLIEPFITRAAKETPHG